VLKKEKKANYATSFSSMKLKKKIRQRLISKHGGLYSSNKHTMGLRERVGKRSMKRTIFLKVGGGKARECSDAKAGGRSKKWRREEVSKGS